ncbi:MAG: hypothetical protein ACYTF1_18895, partial [Planctomycetota bacterium]
PLTFLSAKLEPNQICLGETSKLSVAYRGFRPRMTPILPQVEGLAIKSTGPPRTEVTRREGMPVTTYQFDVRASKLGTYQIKGIVLDKVPADPVTLKVAPFVIVGTQVGDQSVVVGGQTTVHVMVRGILRSQGLTLVAPQGLTVIPAKQRYRGPAGTTVFSFDVTPTEPGTPTINTIKLADGRKVTLAQPITLSVRQSGEGGILACKGIPRSEQTVIGEPFIVDYQVFYRGNLLGAGVDCRDAAFGDKPYIKVEPVNDLSYPDWTGQPMPASFGEDRIIMLAGSGIFNKQKEQAIRFALKITPLAAGELSLEGLRVILRLQIKEEKRTRRSLFSSSQTRDFDRLAEVPPHSVIDPPGKQAPRGYRGAVGTAFKFITQLDRTKATAMSPLTLTMKIAGESVGPQFKPPILADVPEMNRLFDVSPTIGGGDVENNTITFTQVVRPRSEQVAELPALPLVYYNYRNKKYDTVYSLPIPIEVTPGSLVDAGDMQVTPTQTTSKTEVTAPQIPTAEIVTLGANHTTLGQVVTFRPLGPLPILSVLIGGPACVLLVWVLQRLHRRRQPLSEIKQQRRELNRALKQIGQADNFYEELARLLQAYLRLTFNLPPGELSLNILAQVFEERSVDKNLQQEVEELLGRCDTGRFAVGSTDDQEKNRLIEQTRQLFNKIDRGVK